MSSFINAGYRYGTNNSGSGSTTLLTTSLDDAVINLHLLLEVNTVCSLKYFKRTQYCRYDLIWRCFFAQGLVSPTTCPCRVTWTKTAATPLMSASSWAVSTSSNQAPHKGCSSSSARQFCVKKSLSTPTPMIGALSAPFFCAPVASGSLIRISWRSGPWTRSRRSKFGQSRLPIPLRWGFNYSHN